MNVLQKTFATENIRSINVASFHHYSNLWLALEKSACEWSSHGSKHCRSTRHSMDYPGVDNHLSPI